MPEVRPILTGHKALVVGIANDQSTAYGCAEAFRTAGADLAVTWLNDKARPHAAPLGAALGAEITAPAALEAACRYLAFELGKQDVRVHAISPGPLQTRASSGLKDFERLLNDAVERAPLHDLVKIEDVGSACAYLASDYSRRITGGTIYIDGGGNIVA